MNTDLWSNWWQKTTYSYFCNYKVKKLKTSNHCQGYFWRHNRHNSTISREESQNRQPSSSAKACLTSCFIQNWLPWLQKRIMNPGVARSVINNTLLAADMRVLVHSYGLSVCIPNFLCFLRRLLPVDGMWRGKIPAQQPLKWRSTEFKTAVWMIIKKIKFIHPTTIKCKM